MKFLGEQVVRTSYPAATASWIALQPTLVEPPQMMTVSPFAVGFGVAVAVGVGVGVGVGFREGYFRPN